MYCQLANSLLNLCCTRRSLSRQSGTPVHSLRLQLQAGQRHRQIINHFQQKLYCLFRDKSSRCIVDRRICQGRVFLFNAARGIHVSGFDGRCDEALIGCCLPCLAAPPWNSTSQRPVWRYEQDYSFTCPRDHVVFLNHFLFPFIWYQFIYIPLYCPFQAEQTCRPGEVLGSKTRRSESWHSSTSRNLNTWRLRNLIENAKLQQLKLEIAKRKWPKRPQVRLMKLLRSLHQETIVFHPCQENYWN